MPPASPEVLRDRIDSPPDRLRSAIGSWSGPALLEGGPGQVGGACLWSILAARPRRLIESSGGRRFRVWGSGFVREMEGDPLDGLAAFAREFHLAQPGDQPEPDVPPFQGGLIGHLSYDLAPTIERLPRRVPADSRMPDLRFGLYDTFVVLDHRDGTAELWAVDLLGEGSGPLRARRNQWLADLERTGATTTRPAARLSHPEPSFSREGYLAAVTRTLEYLRAGDIFQANLSQRFVATGRVDPLALYLRLGQASPAPHAAFLAWDDLAIISASPELFWKTEGDRITTRPIKGTRPRSTDPVEDARLAAELAESAKDRAELTMIVDLERNDLGRICQFGSIQVVEDRKVESFANVHHLVATIEGRLRPEVGLAELIRAIFPGGSITGAPKIRAMEIIDELEPNRRSVYTGAVGWLGRRGQSAFNIAIRTLLVEGSRVSYQVGGGIVADSDPESEYLETLHKGRDIRRVLAELEVAP